MRFPGRWRERRPENQDVAEKANPETIGHSAVSPLIEDAPTRFPTEQFREAIAAGDVLAACLAQGELMGVDADSLRPGVNEILDAAGNPRALVVASAADSSAQSVRRYHDPMSEEAWGAESDATYRAIAASGCVGAFRVGILPGSFSLVTPRAECLYGIAGIPGNELGVVGHEEIGELLGNLGYLNIDRKRGNGYRGSDFRFPDPLEYFINAGYEHPLDMPEGGTPTPEMLVLGYFGYGPEAQF